MEAIIIYDVATIKIWKIDTFVAHNEVVGDISAWCTYNNEDNFNKLKETNNIYMFEDSSQEFPKHKIAVLASEIEIIALDQEGTLVDISHYNIPDGIIVRKILTHEEKLLVDPIYKYCVDRSMNG